MTAKLGVGYFEEHCLRILQISAMSLGMRIQCV